MHNKLEQAAKEGDSETMQNIFDESSYSFPKKELNKALLLAVMNC